MYYFAHGGDGVFRILFGGRVRGTRLCTLCFRGAANWCSCRAGTVPAVVGGPRCASGGTTPHAKVYETRTDSEHQPDADLIENHF